MTASSNKNTLTLREFCLKLISELRNFVDTGEDAQWQYDICSFDERDLFAPVRGTWRMAFKSRDRDCTFFGLGAADLVRTEAEVVTKAPTLKNGQIYFGAIRFDDSGDVANEWQSFGKKIFILPMLMVSKINGHETVSLNFRRDSHLSFSHWLDHVYSLLYAIAQASPSKVPQIDFAMGEVIPGEREYFQNVEMALAALLNDPSDKKVVMGRRRSISIKSSVDPIDLFFRLKTKSQNAFLFYLDDGQSTAFFGGSPELLYRRINRHFETESLAGTRARSADELDDFELRENLLNSFKDNREHALVSTHIEQRLKDFGTTDLFTSKLEIMALPYVQHLVRRYRGTINPVINDASIIKALHPTPAVCGLDLAWALNFIKAHEGFDRGFYAGPIGYVGKDDAEFAVGIRSALFHKQQLFIYAACGIVPGSVFEQEWEELNNKEKNIMSIFEDLV